MSKSTRSTKSIQGGFNKQHLIPFLRWLLTRHAKLGGVTEIRAIADQPAKMVWSGYFGPGHLDDLVRQIRPLPDGPRDKIPFGKSPSTRTPGSIFPRSPTRPHSITRASAGGT